MAKSAREILSMNNEDLFAQAQAAAVGRQELFCSPNLINGACTTRPTCRHCKWENKKNVDPAFKRKRTHEEILERTKLLVDYGIHRMFMPSGWMGYEVPHYYYECIEVVKKNCSLEVYALFGALNRKCLGELKAAGLDGYLCGIESPSEQVYRRFRPGGDSLSDRKNALQAAKEVGLKIWSGFLTGLGESEEDIMAGLSFLADLEVDSISILPFTPYPHTEMIGENPANPLQWARTVAAARVLLDKPDVFSTREEFYGEYARIAGVNGYYVFPPGKI